MKELFNFYWAYYQYLLIKDPEARAITLKQTLTPLYYTAYLPTYQFVNSEELGDEAETTEGLYFKIEKILNNDNQNPLISQCYYSFFTQNDNLSLGDGNQIAFIIHLPFSEIREIVLSSSKFDKMALLEELVSICESKKWRFDDFYVYNEEGLLVDLDDVSSLNLENAKGSYSLFLKHINAKYVPTSFFQST